MAGDGSGGVVGAHTAAHDTHTTWTGAPWTGAPASIATADPVPAGGAVVAGLDSEAVGVLQRAGALSVRPGFQVSGGWFTGRRALVVTVPKKLPDPPAGRALPATIAGLPVDVREASTRKRDALLDPAAYDTAHADTPLQRAVPQFPDEHLVTPDGLTAVTHVNPAAARPAKPHLPYTAPPGVALSPVTDTVTIELSASPDSGWPVLQAFLAATTSHLSVALYDFTSAHVLDVVTTATTGKTVDLVIDRPPNNPTADQTDEATVAALHGDLGQHLAHAWALTGTDRHAAAAIFPNAYHIKVAVRDHRSVWLSSGNWNNSNQPAIDPVHQPSDAEAARAGDRDWHVVIDHPGLAAVFEAFIAHDLQIAAAHQQPGTVPAGPPLPPPSQGSTKTPPYAGFAAATTITEPVTITPLLTPDPGDYTSAIKALIGAATTSLYMQFQYIHVPKPGPDTQPFADLIAAVIDRQQAGVDVRIIMSEFENTGFLEQLAAAGLDVTTRVKIQNNVHNKGIVVDTATVLVSSQNWSADGVLHNRDAGVILANPSIAAYYQQLFLHDWDHLATHHTHDD